MNDGIEQIETILVVRGLVRRALRRLEEMVSSGDPREALAAIELVLRYFPPNIELYGLPAEDEYEGGDEEDED
jgi:hypothetical protein